MLDFLKNFGLMDYGIVGLIGLFLYTQYQSSVNKNLKTELEIAKGSVTDVKLAQKQEDIETAMRELPKPEHKELPIDELAKKLDNI